MKEKARWSPCRTGTVPEEAIDDEEERLVWLRYRPLMRRR